jgi:uncharacterized membrane-anchored protein
MKTALFARTCAAVLAGTLAFGTSPAQAATIDQEAEMKTALAAARAASQSGPSEIALGSQAKLKLPQGYSFIPQPQAGQLLKAMGNGEDSSRLGIVIPPDSDSFVVPRYIDAGYIKDDEAAEWKADELLSGLKEGTEENNKERQARGLTQMEIVGWNQKPSYDKGAHRLVWSIETKDKGTANGEHGANYNTYVLGREGYLSMNLVSGFDALAANKPFAQTLLAQTSFNPGKTYADFNSSTDKMAEYGIAALVTGVAVKKLGLFAVMAAFFAKFAKLIAIAAFGLVAGARKFFKRSGT